MKFRILFILLFTCALGFAQNSATINGTVTDRDMGGETLPFAAVKVKGTTINATTDESGKYTLTVPAGTHTLIFSFLGYLDEVVTVSVAAGETKTIDKELHSESVQLQDVVIEKTVTREKESVLLLEQKKAVEIKQSIGAQELSRKGIGDVEEGLTKITGITKVGSRGLFVRGLEDRYNNLLINDLAVPSNNPFQKIVPLDLFPTDIVSVLEVFKTFNVNNYGDFAGGTFNIVTSKGTKAITKLSIGVGYTTNNNLSDFKISDDAASTKGFFGLTGKDREMPGIFGTTPANRTLTAGEAQQSFKSGFNVNSSKSPLNTSIGVLHSERFDFKNNDRITYLLSLNSENSYTVRSGAENTFYGSLSDSGTSEVIYLNKFYTTDYRYKTNTSLLVGTNYKSQRLDLSLTAFYLRNTESSIRDQFGVLDSNFNNPNTLVRTNQLDQSDYITAQLTGKYFLNEDQSQFVRAGASFSTTSYQQPDRKFFLGTLEGNNIIMNPGGNNLLRQYFDIKSDSYFSALAEYGIKFGGEDKKHQLTLGYNGNTNNVDTSYRFILASSGSVFTSPIDEVDTQINAALASGDFSYRESSVAQYKSKLAENVNAGYANVLLHFGEKWEVTGGIRFERVSREIKFRENSSFDDPFLKVTFNKNYFLPSANIKYSLNDKSNLRFAASQTYTRPILMEMLPITYVNADHTSQSGNQRLVNSDNFNADIKYEVFPTSTEMFSAGIFGKKIDNAIERTFQSTASGAGTTFLNTGDAILYGAELDFIMSLGRLSESLSKVSLGFNTSVMNTKVDTKDTIINSSGNPSEAIETHPKRQLQGASKWLINSDLKYEFNFSESWTNTVSLVYSVFGKRIYSVGTRPLDHMYELPVHRVDLVWGSKISEHFDFKLAAHNLLNPKVRFETGDDTNASLAPVDNLINSEYKRGVGFSLGLNYTF